MKLKLLDAELFLRSFYKRKKDYESKKLIQKYENAKESLFPPCPPNSPTYPQFLHSRTVLREIENELIEYAENLINSNRMAIGNIKIIQKINIKVIKNNIFTGRVFEQFAPGEIIIVSHKIKSNTKKEKTLFKGNFVYTEGVTVFETGFLLDDNDRKNTDLKIMQYLDELNSKEGWDILEIVNRLNEDTYYSFIAEGIGTITNSGTYRFNILDVITTYQDKTNEKSVNITRTQYNYSEYDIVLSFAGEDRQHAKTLAHTLKSNGYSVFYDEFETENLWGKDLAVYLHEIYSKKGKHCVIFISKHYTNKIWTNHEFRAALQKLVHSMGTDYILPIRIDESELPGLPKTLAYLNITAGIDKIGELLLKKLKK